MGPWPTAVQLLSQALTLKWLMEQLHSMIRLHRLLIQRHTLWMHNNIASNDFRLLRDLIPEQAYKNSGKEIQSILKGVVGKTCDEIRSYYNSKSESEHEIWVGPSGGSLVKAGSTPLGMNQKEDTDAIAKTPSCMNPNAAEQRFIDAVRYRAVVVLYAPERWLDDIRCYSTILNITQPWQEIAESKHQ